MESSPDDIIGKALHGTIVSWNRGAEKLYGYGLLDSHTLLGQGSSVRIDSFVYTSEGLREARARLKQGGVLSLSFSVLSDGPGRKIYLMLQEAFDGRPPICVASLYDASVIFLESNDPGWAAPHKLIEDAGFKEKTMNLLGATCGGLLEYNSMYFGFRFLYALAMACYFLAFISDAIVSKKKRDNSTPVLGGDLST